MFAEWCMSHFVYKMVGVSEQTTANLHKYEKIPQKKLMTIANGIDGSRFAIDIDRQAKRIAIGIPSDGPLIGVISRLEKVKGITYLLQSMPELTNIFPDLTLLIVGDGFEMENLQLESNQLGVNHNVMFIGARYDIPEILQILDIYILPSLSEGLPIGLLEAMAAGCPVIASNVGGIPGAVEHNKSAILVSPGKPKELGDAIVALWNDQNLRKKIARTSQKYFYERYCSKMMMQRYCELYWCC